MCGIYGYQGHKNVWKELVGGLEKLEYRGYDSAGVVLLDEIGAPTIIKSIGRVSELSSKIMGDLKSLDKKFASGMGHTRRATHGGVTVENAHPHTDMNQTFFVIHNGIIENFQELKNQLISEGVIFYSETDTEVIPNLLAKHWTGDFLETVEKVLPILHGAYALVIMTSYAPGQMIGVKLASPLMFGVNGDEYYLSSDMPSLANKVNDIYVLDEGELVLLDKGEFVIKSQGEKILKQPTQFDADILDVQKGDYDHWMLKEIMEQPHVIRETLRGRINFDDELLVASSLLYLDQFDFDSICFVACGTSYNAGIYGTYVMENMCGLQTQAYIASEFEYRNIAVNQKTLYIFLSQSGETADTIDCLKKVKACGGISFGIVNVVGSTMSRLTDCGMFMRAGAEIGVASTKAFTAQITIILLLGLYFARKKGTNRMITSQVIQSLQHIPDQLETMLGSYAEITHVARVMMGFTHGFYLGKHYQLAIAHENSLKFKEITYIHTESYAMAELKHGPLALLDTSFPVIALCPRDQFYAKNISNIQETKARRAPIITIGDEKVEIADYHLMIPKTIDILYPYFTTIVGQLLAYETARLLGREIDKPRNLAKSVTVK